MNIKRILIPLLLILFMASMAVFGAPVYVNVGPTTEFDGDIKILSEIVAEGVTPDDWETTVVFTDPTADRTITIPDYDVTVGSAILLTVTDNENTNENNAILFTSGGVEAGVLNIESDGGDFYYNPSTGTVTATSYSGDGSNLTGIGVAASTSLTISAKVSEAGGIDKGEVVYFSGAVGQVPQVSLADNTVAGKACPIGIAAETKADNADILIRVAGQITSLDTSAFADGDCLFLSTAGSMIATTPTSGVIIRVAGVEYDHAGSGKLLVNIGRTPQKGATSGTDLYARLGDNDGNNKYEFKDYANNVVGYIDSDGEFIGLNIERNKWDATQAPAAATDDITLGYEVGSRWIDVTNDKEYICLDNTDGAAVWTETTQAGGGSGTVDTSGSPVANDIPRFTDTTTIEGLSYAEFKAALDLEIGTDIQAFDNALTNISALAYVSPSLIKLTANDTYAVRTLAEVKEDLSLNNVTNVATDDTAYNATSWDSNTDAATKNAIRDKIETMGGYTNLTSFVDQTAWRVFYSNTDGDVVELALGDDGQYLMSNGVAVAPSFETPAGSGDMLKATYDADEDDDIDVAAGGTEKSSWTLYAIPYLSGTTAFGEIPVGTAEYALTVAAGATGYDWTDMWTESENTAAAYISDVSGDSIGDLSDVGDSTMTDKYVLVADGDSWESRALAEADISDLGTYIENIVEDTTPELGGEMDAGTHTIGFTLQSTTGDGTTTIDWKLGNKFKFTFGAQNETFTFTAPTNPCTLMLTIIQDGTGSRTITWPATVKWPSGTAPTLTTTANARDKVALDWDGAQYDGTTGLDFK